MPNEIDLDKAVLINIPELNSINLCIFYIKRWNVD